MNKLKFLVIMSVILILDGNSFFKTQAIERSSSQIKHEASIDYKIVDEQVLIPFIAFMNLIGISDIQWEPRDSDSIEGHLILEEPGVFGRAYASNLIRGLEPREDDELERVPSTFDTVIKNIVKDTSESSPKPTSDLSTKRLIMKINSDGFSTGYATYNYKMINGCIYMPPQELKGFGFQELNINPNSNCAIVTYYTPEQLTKQALEKVSPIENTIKVLQPQDIISLWIRGQQTRSGALQYNLLSPELQCKVIEEAKTIGWVTGGSSPTLLHGKDTVTHIDKVSEDAYVYTIRYESMLQGQVYEILDQTVTVSKCREENTNYWCITKVIGDVGYYTFENVAQ